MGFSYGNRLMIASVDHHFVVAYRGGNAGFAEYIPKLDDEAFDPIKQIGSNVVIKDQIFEEFLLILASFIVFINSFWVYGRKIADFLSE
jgi:hypothetical protein